MTDELRSKVAAQGVIIDKMRSTVHERVKGESKNNKQPASSNMSNGLFAHNHTRDEFYTKFEDMFRGSESLIQERISEYLPDFTDRSKVDFTKYPALDIGCGRGEFLSLMQAHGLKATGIDINFEMVKRAGDKGLKAIQGDAIEHLLNVKPGVYGAITGFHIVEHIPFDTLLEMFDAAHQALVEDGFVLFETPNPENIVVGACNFYMDPSHLNPIPPSLLKFAVESAGFRNVEIRRLHPMVDREKLEKIDDTLYTRLYGSRDYAVIGYK